MTPVHIGDAMFIGVVTPTSDNNAKTQAISSVSENPGLPINEVDDTDRQGKVLPDSEVSGGCV